MASNIFRVLALIQLLQCAYTLEIVVEAEVDLCLPLSDGVGVVTTLYTNLASKTITADVTSVAQAPWSGGDQLVVIIPDYGYISSDSVEVGALVEAYITANVNVSVILVNIGPVLEDLGSFITTVVNGVSQIADDVLNLLKIVLDTIPEITNTHLLGIGLGAHISGKIGRSLKVDTVTALDPLGALFDQTDLSANIAPVVQVFHSSGLGHKDYLGSLDIILADGKYQPGCPSATYPNLDECSHVFAVTLYAKILKGAKIYGKICDDLSVTFPNPINDCQKAYSSMGILDITVKANICKQGIGDLVSIGRDANLSLLNGKVVHVNATALLDI